MIPLIVRDWLPLLFVLIGNAITYCVIETNYKHILKVACHRMTLSFLMIIILSQKVLRDYLHLVHIRQPHDMLNVVLVSHAVTSGIGACDVLNILTMKQLFYVVFRDLVVEYWIYTWPLLHHFHMTSGTFNTILSWTLTLAVYRYCYALRHRHSYKVVAFAKAARKVFAIYRYTARWSSTVSMTAKVIVQPLVTIIPLPTDMQLMLFVGSAFFSWCEDAFVTTFNRYTRPALVPEHLNRWRVSGDLPMFPQQPMVAVN